jgi:homoserine kinase
VRVRVPATSANLGPGFDAFGLALSRTDEVRAEIIPSGLEVSAEGEGSAAIPTDEQHLIVRSMRAAFAAIGRQPPGLRLHSHNCIPHGRGLGSSAAAIVAGIQLARGLALDGRTQLDDGQALALASRIEGHPDNVAACLLGGLTVAWTAEGQGRAVRVEPSGFVPVLFIATEQSATHAARAALPPMVPHADAAFNSARAALLVIAMTGRPDLLMTATEDRLHQGYRAAGMPQTSALVAELRSHGIAAVVSGAGSSVLALARDDGEVALGSRVVPQGWECAQLAVADGASYC